MSYQMRNFSLFLIYWEYFLKWMLTFIKCFFCISSDDMMTNTARFTYTISLFFSLFFSVFLFFLASLLLDKNNFFRIQFQFFCCLLGMYSCCNKFYPNWFIYTFFLLIHHKIHPCKVYDSGVLVYSQGCASNTTN